jgi:hypothetical protein
MNRHTTLGTLFKIAVFFLLPITMFSSTGSTATGRFTADAIVEHIKFLASDSMEGRLGGSEGARAASEYIGNQFRNIELEPAGENGGYFQEFTFVSEVVAGDSNELIVVCGGLPVAARQGIDFSPLGPSANGVAEGTTVFIRYGLKNEEEGYDDFAGVRMEGAIAIALDGVPPELEGSEESRSDILLRKKSMLAREVGAVGLLIVRGKDDETPMGDLEYDGTPGDVGIPFVQLSWEFGAQILRCAGITMKDDERVPPSKDLPNAIVKLTADVRQVRATGRNVIATLEGSDPSLRDQHIVLGAHFDHIGTGTDKDGNKIIYNGADDNASGVAGLLELAASLSANCPRRSILFISFDAEELGALGSLHFMKKPTIPREKISAMLNLDMIGRMQERTLVVSGYDTSPAWNDLLDRSNEGLDLDLKKSSGGFGGSDHTAFYKDDIPVLFFFTGAHDDYNTPNDDWDRINAEGEALILEYIDRVILAIGNADDLPPFKRSEAAKGRGGRGSLPVYMGTVPDFTHEGEGFAIIGTKEGSPAEKAGLLKGDVIVRMDGTDVRNIYDFMGVLSGQKPGNVIDVVVIREGAEVTIPVTLGKK